MRIAFLSAAVVTFGCGGAPPAPTGPPAATVLRAEPDGRTTRESSNLPEGPQSLRTRFNVRPTTIDESEFDFATIPMMESIAFHRWEPGASFTLVPGRNDIYCIWGPSWLEARAWLAPQWPAQTIVEIDDNAISAFRLLGGLYMDFQTSERLERSSDPLGARWLQMPDASRTAELATLNRFEGSFDPVSGEVRAERQLTVHAKALVPGEFYAYRRCDEFCDDDEMRVEILTLVGPRSEWVGSTGSWSEQQELKNQDFTAVSAQLGQGGSTSLTITTTSTELAHFARKTAPTGNRNTVAFTLDVVWPRGGAPEARLFTLEAPRQPDKFSPLEVPTDCKPMSPIRAAI